MDSLDSFAAPAALFLPLTFFHLRRGHPPHPPTAFPQLVDSSSQRRSVAFQAAMPPFVGACFPIPFHHGPRPWHRTLRSPRPCVESHPPTRVTPFSTFFSSLFQSLPDPKIGAVPAPMLTSNRRYAHPTQTPRPLLLRRLPPRRPTRHPLHCRRRPRLRDRFRPIPRRSHPQRRTGDRPVCVTTPLTRPPPNPPSSRGCLGRLS